MAELSLTYRTEVNYKYFENWLQTNYSSNYDGMQVDVDTNVVLFFFNALTTQEETDITDFHTNMDGTETLDDLELKIYDWISVDEETNKFEIPKHVNYKYELNIRLHPVITSIVKGEVREIVYYESSTLQADGTLLGTNPVIKESYVYVRDAGHFALNRTCTITWFKKDDTEHSDNKVRVKNYSSTDAISEGFRRRQNIVSALQLPIVGLIMQTTGMSQNDAIVAGSTFMEDYELEILSFVNTPKKYSFPNRVTAETNYTWLDNDIGGGVTIRAYILDAVDLDS